MNIINGIMKNKKLIIVLIMIILIVFSVNNVYAENETNTGNNEGTTTQGDNTGNNNTKPEEPKPEEPKPEEPKPEEPKNTEPTKETSEKTPTTENKKTETNSNTKNTTTPSTTQTVTKSSNADLGNLGITPYDFSGFTASKTEYEVSVPNSVKSVEVYAKAKDSKATLSGTGKVELTEGNNNAEVEVTAEDGTKKTYTIVITRLKEGEKLEKKGSTEKTSLKSLKVSGFELMPDFKEDVLEYTVSFEGEQTSLDITAEANQSSDFVEIIGNENLVDGENIITILVSNSKEDSTIIYEIKVNKNFEKAKALQKEKEDAERWENIKKWGLRILPFVAIFGLMILIIIRHKREQKEEYEEDNEDLPKSLRKKKVAKSQPQPKKKSKKSKGKHGK